MTRCGGQVPLAPRVVAGETGVAHVVLVQTEASILSGDRVEITVRVGPGARLLLSTAAATVAYPALCPATQSLSVAVAPAGRFAWVPSALVLAHGCDLRSELEVALEAGAAAYVRELIVAGRHGESAGRYESTFRSELDGRPLLHDRIRVDPSTLESGLALRGARAFASQALLGIEDSRPLGGGESRLAGPGRVCRTIDVEAARVVATVTELEGSYLAALWEGPDV